MAKIGSQNITADGVIGVSGRPVRLYNIQVMSGGTAAVVSIYSGTSTSGTKLDQIDGTISKSVSRGYEGGLYFPNGLYVDLDANTTFVTCGFENEL